ncbi:MAG: hypothetical protein WCF24_11300 [Acidimicrobiales bacterium]
MRMIVSVTVLGSSDGSTPITIGERVVEYLEGGVVVRGGRKPGATIALSSP